MGVLNIMGMGSIAQVPARFGGIQLLLFIWYPILQKVHCKIVQNNARTLHCFYIASKSGAPQSTLNLSSWCNISLSLSLSLCGNLAWESQVQSVDFKDFGWNFSLESWIMKMFIWLWRTYSGPAPTYSKMMKKTHLDRLMLCSPTSSQLLLMLGSDSKLSFARTFNSRKSSWTVHTFLVCEGRGLAVFQSYPPMSSNMACRRKFPI